MSEKLNINELLILENELKIMFAIAAHTERKYSEISKAQYNFAESIYLYREAKLKDFKELPLTAKLANYILARTESSVWSPRVVKSNINLVEKVIDRFDLDNTPEIIEILSNIANLIQKIEDKSAIILLLSMISKGMEDLKKRKNLI
jgi:hypothetical protein